MSLRSRIFTAGAWTLGSYSIELVTRLITNLVMTRLLFPEAFGVVAASTSIIIGLTLVSDFGVRTAIIHSARGHHDDFLRSAWVFQLSRGFIVWLILIAAVASVPIIRGLFSATSVFAERSFPIITVVLGFQLVLSGLESTTLALNIRQLNFRPVVIVDLAGKICAIPVMIASTVVLPNAWALVIGALVAGLVRVILSHLYVPGPKMMLKSDAAHLKEIFHFGKWITVSSIASFVSSQTDIIALGLLLPSAFLGIYSIAKVLVNTVEGLLEKLNGTLTLPVLGEVLRVNPADLRDRYYRFRLPIEAAATFCAGFLFTTADLIVGVMYDARYSEAGPMLRILSIGLAFYPFQLIRSAFTAIGQTYVVATISIIEAVSMSVLLFIGYTEFGSLGAITGIAINRFVPSMILIYLAYRQNWISLRHELRTIPIFLFGLLIGEATLMIGRIVAAKESLHFPN
jgi:O-antigen/teichoic acid export membrane protein